MQSAQLTRKAAFHRNWPQSIQRTARRSSAFGLYLLISSALNVALAQTNTPVGVPPRVILTPSSSQFLNKSLVAPLPVSANLLQTPLPATNFVVGQDVYIPPDTYGAVGTNYLTMTLNDRTVVNTRSGSEVLYNDIGNFWTSTNISSSPRPPFDPRIVYDPFYGRWIAVALLDYNLPASSRMLLAVSETSEPTNAWYKWEFKADTNSPAQYWADYPQVGFNKQWIVVQANMLGSNSVSHFWVFNKTNVYAGNTNNYKFLAHIDPTLAGSEVPALMYDTNASTMYLLQSANSNTNGYGWLRLFSITGAVDSAGLNTNLGYVKITNTWAHLPKGTVVAHYFDFAPQKDGSNDHLISTQADSRIQSLVFRNGSLWAAQTIFLGLTNGLPSRSSIQWWEIKPEPLELVQVGRIDDPTGVNFYGFPSLAVNKFDDVLIGYNSFSSNQYASANISFRAFYDPKNQMRPTRVFKEGRDLFIHTRWGDYSSTVIDPLNDSDFWTIQMYAGTNLVDEDYNASIVWAPVSVPVPANDHFTNYISITGAQGSTNGTNIRGTKETGEPDHAGTANSVSVWYRWTAPSSGSVKFETTNNFRAILAAYTGSTVGGLTLVTNGQSSDGIAPARIVFNASSNTTYQIAVDGYNNSPMNQGNFLLQWSLPAAPLFTVQPQGRDVFMSNNVTFSAMAISTPDPAYQWRRNGSDIPGATSSSFTTNNVQTNSTGDFTVVASNIYGAATSHVAHLEVYSTERALMSSPSHLTNSFRQVVSGITGSVYIVEASTNLLNWTPLETNSVTFTNLDTAATNYSRRFYRVRTQ